MPQYYTEDIVMLSIILVDCIIKLDMKYIHMRFAGGMQHWYHAKNSNLR